MDNESRKKPAEQHAADSPQKRKLEKKIKNTARNMEIAEEIRAETPDDRTRDEMHEENLRREHAIAGMKKDIRDLAQKKHQ